MSVVKKPLKRIRLKYNGFYYVICKALDSHPLFPTSEYQKYLFRTICKTGEHYHIRVHDYLFLEHEYHILLEVSESNLSRMMGYVNAQYTRYYNRKMHRSGPLWKHRYTSYYLNCPERVDHLLMAMEEHPVREGLASRVGEYTGSMLHQLVQRDMPYCKETLLLSHELLSRLLGGESCSERLPDLIQKMRRETLRIKRAQIPKQERIHLEDLFKDTERRSRRNHAIYQAYLLGFTQTAIAAHLGLSIATVNKIVKKYRPATQQNPPAEAPSTHSLRSCDA